jgi:guanosine-3',5'-bis(diphosphate) 3'-pyrophosphohydrolase
LTEGRSQVVQTIEELLALIAPRSSREDLALVERAYRLAEAAHRDQKRSGGEPYITHPLAVAGILAHTKLDTPTIIAALLHDVVEDTPVTLDDIRAQFGDEVAKLVDAVTKLKKRTGDRNELAAGAPPDDTSEAFSYRTERDAESLRKMLLGLADDVRVVLVKLADRLHNMQTLGSMPPEKQRRIARETLDIYAPLANRLGIWEWKTQLEDLGFRYADPDQYAYLARMLEAGAEERERRIQRYIAILRDALSEVGISNVEITGRAKQLYSIWRKMQRKNTSFDKIRDTQAIRVIIEDGSDEQPIDNPPLDSSAGDQLDESSDASPKDETEVADIVGKLQKAAERDRKARSRERAQKLAARNQLMSQPAVQLCYAVLGVVHRLWKPIPGEFDDYIAVPKDNHYQSLHTAVITDDGSTLEVQIRTRAMHKAAEYGVAAHWLYKDDAPLSADYQKHIEQLREAIRLLGSEAEDAASFVDALKTDQFKDTVFCFTPKGKLIELPAGATVLDFAYRIHTDLGHHCYMGKVNGRPEPLTYKLKNGDQVEVLTRPNAQPKREWLHNPDYLATSAARHKVRQWFRRQDREQNIAAGREIIERELKRMGVSSWMKLADVFRLFKVEPGKEEEFLERVGYGNITLMSISSRILEEERRRQREQEERRSGLAGLTALILPKRLPPTDKGGYFVVAGVHDLRCTVAQCCNPRPGDPVIGYVTRGQGVKVHRRDCKNILNAEQERLVEVTYIGEPSEVFPVQLEVVAAERQGLLAELTKVLADAKINITDIGIVKRDVQFGEVKLRIKAELLNASQVAAVMNRLKQVRNVFEVNRLSER